MATVIEIGSTLAISPPHYAVVCCDAEDIIISWDVQAERLFGLAYKDALGRRLFSLICSKNPAQSELRLASLFQQHRKEASVTLMIEETAVHQSGRAFPVELIISPLPGAEYFTIFIRNVQALQRQEAAVSERLFLLEVINTILEMSLEPTLLKDRLTAILSYIVSLEELDLLPKAALFLIEQDTQTLILSVEQGFDDERSAACKRVPFGQCGCGKAALVNKIQYVTTASKRHLAPSPTDEPHGNYCVPIASHGLVTGVMCLYVRETHQRSRRIESMLKAIALVIGKIIDNQKMDLQLINLVNDLRVSILDLREERNFSESVIQGLEHGLLVCDQEGIIQKINDVAKRILQPFAHTFIGHSLASIIGAEKAGRILDVNKEPNGKEENELALLTENSDELVLRYSSVNRNDIRGRCAGTIISLSDVSEWRYVRKEMEKMNRLSTVAEIASAVAHEVRNPLAGIKIMAQSIEEDSGTEEERIECSRRIIRQVDRLNELLTDFFSYARPVVPKKQAVSIENILAETKPLIINKLVKQRIYLLEDFEQDLPLVIADPNQVQQVFLNLFLNSIDAIKQGGKIEIRVLLASGQRLARCRKKHHLPIQNGRYVMVLFRDNGAGMSQESTEKVFEPFYTTKSNGSGLGMSIVYRTLKENDAHISVESTEGKGTTFTMYFRSN